MGRRVIQNWLNLHRMPSPRRRFLSWIGSASLVGITARPSVLRAEAMRTDRTDDRHAPPVTDAWDMGWTARVTGKYKAVFDSPGFAYGAALFRANAWCEQYKEVFGAERCEMSPVVVLRHSGFDLAMNGEYWRLAEVGRKQKLRDQRGKKWLMTNPLAAAADGAPPDTVKNTIPAFVAAGGIVLGCGWSFGGAVAIIRQVEQLDKETAEARVKSMLLPGVILQPSGIFAALRAQEAGCSYILAS